MGIVHIWPEPLIEREGIVETSATIEIPGKERRILRFEVSEQYRSAVTPTCDPFVVGTIQILMAEKHDAHVHGQVSPSLLQNLEEYVQARALWRPNLSRAAIRADLEEEPSFTNDRSKAILAFSGGVDSGFTVFRHARGNAHFPRELAAGVMARGFDIPSAENEGFIRAAERSRLLLKSLGLDLIPMASNFRAVVGTPGYDLSWGTAVASCLMVLQGGFSAGLLSQSVAYDDLFELDWGCNPLTDRMLSSASFEIIPDGANFGRIEKIEALNEWPEFLSHARVCWKAPERDRNCCECEKCIRTILGFRSLGLPLPPCFSHDVSIEQIMALDKLPEKSMTFWYDPILRVAEERGIDEPWTRALNNRLVRNRKTRKSKTRQQVQRVIRYSKRIPGRLRAKFSSTQNGG
jgi:hypothetical protein